MNRYKLTGASGEQVAKRMLKLAWDASKVLGFGVLQDRGCQMTEEQVWKQAITHGDYPFAPVRAGRVNADYVFGRMMKLRFDFGDDYVAGDNNKHNPEYQSFAGKYADFDALLKAAVATLEGAQAE